MAGKRLFGEKKDTPKKVQFEFLAPEAHEVFIAGEFNHWERRANPLKKDKNGMWKLTLPLMPGRYEYRFVTDGSWENDPACSGCVPNDFGSLNCVRIVE
ncbi:MAG TPA: isoamylase early set domain-containing protein [Thermodesulfobacteriota bacterium]|nr:isoamylase early set domain-containing protein [Thermodesulfobacteriota bacterium]